MTTRQRATEIPAATSRYDRNKGHKETVRMLLAQIYAHAERQRADKQSAQSRQRGKHGEMAGSDRVEAPLSLIELIQASGTVFERYGIGAPDDAVYHRYLLSLSIDPDPDWRKKIAGFRLGDQPRVRRLRSVQLDDHGAPAASLMAVSQQEKGAWRASQMRQDARSPYRRRREDRASSSHPLKRQSGSARVDQFSDVLSRRGSYDYDRAFTTDQPPGALIRPVSPVQQSTPRTGPSSLLSRSSDDENAVAPSPFTRQMSVSRLLRLQSGDQRTGSSMSEGLRHSTRDESMDDTNDADDAVSADTDAISDYRRRANEFKSAMSDAQLLSTAFEQWKAMRDLRKLVEMRKDQDIRMRRALMPTAAVYAVFRWIALCLPEKYAVTSHAISRDLFVPAALARRINVTQRSSVSNLSMLNKFGRRLLLSRVKGILASWHRRAVGVLDLRRRCLVRQRAQVLETAFQCMLQWRVFAETRKCLVERANWIALRYGRRILRGTLARWQQLLNERQREARATETYALKLATSCWEKWCRLVRARRQVRGIRAGFARKRAISRWKQYTRMQVFIHDQELAVDGHFRFQLLARGWKRLKGHTITEQTLRSKIGRSREARERRCKRAVLCGWREVLESKYQMHELVAKFAKWRRLRLLRRWLIAWTNWVDMRLALAEKLDGAARARRKKLLVAVMREWQLHHEDAVRLDALRVEKIRTSEQRRIWRRWRRLVAVRLVVLAFRRDYDSHVLGKHMKRWRAFTKHAHVWRNAVSTALHNRQHRMLAYCWRLLAQHMEGQRGKKQVATRLLQQRRITSEHVAFCRWSAALALARRRRTQEEHARVAIRRVFLLRRMWCVWRKELRLARLGELAAKNLDSYCKAHMFRVWKHFVQRKRNDRKLCAHAIRRMGLSRTASSFYRWKVLALKVRRMRESARLVSQLCLENSVHQSWKIWRLAHSKAQGQKQQVMRVINKWRSQRLHASFHCWKSRWSLRKRYHHLLQKSHMLSKERVTEIHFQAWKKLWKLRGNANRGFANATKRLQQWKLRRVLDRWRGRLTATRIKGSQLKDALSHWQHVGLAAPFRRWVEFTKTRKLQKTQLAAVATSFHQGLARTHFSRWKTWAQRAKRAASRLNDACLYVQRLRMKRCVRALRSTALTRRRFRCICAQIARSSARGSLGLHFDAWKHFLVARLAQATQQIAHREAIKLCKLRLSIRRWEKRTRMRRLLQSTMLKAAYLSKSTLQQQCFQSWREYTKQRVLRHALTQKALVFQVFCLLPVFFRGWKRYVDQQKRSQALLLRASGLLSHQVEHKAFAAWVTYAKTKKRSLQVIARWQYATMVRCFASWVGFVGHQKMLRSTQEHADRSLAQRRARCALRHWHRTVRTRRILRVLSGQQAERATAEVFACWRRFTCRQRAAKALVGKLQNQTLVRVFNSWKERISLEVSRRKAIRDRFAAMWLADLRGECWTCWKRYARTRRLVRTLLVEKQVEMTRGILTGWRCEVRRRKWSKQCAHVIRNAAAMQAKRVFWNEWRVRLRVLTCARAMQRQMLQRRSSENVRWRFDRWLSFTRVGRCAREQRRRIQLRLMRVVFHDGFAAFARVKAQERALSLQIRDTHRAFLRVWLAEKVHDRIARISAAEQMARERAWRRILHQAWSAWLAYHAQKEATRALTEELRQRMFELGGSWVYQARTMIVRWSRLDVARAMQQWRIQAFTRRRERDNALVAMNWWLSMTVGRAFHGWKHVYVSQKKQRVVQALYVRAAAKRSLMKWKAWRQHRREKEVRDAKARTFRTNSLSRAVFASWKLFSTTKRTQRQLVLAVYRASCVRLLGALMLEWKTFTISSRTKLMQCTVARVVYQERSLRKCVGEWKVRVRQIKSLRQQLQANTERLQVLMMCSCFRAWRVWSKQHRKLARIMSTLSLKCDVRTSVRVFAAWHGYVDARVKHHCLADTFYRFRRYHKGVNALKAMRSRVHHRAQLLKKAQLFKTVLQRTQLSSLFARWKKFAALARRTRAVTLQYLQGKLLPTFWRAWVEVVRRRRSLTVTARAIATTWTNISVRRAWNAVAAYRLYRLAQKERLIQGETHFHTRQLHLTVRFWRASTEWERNFASVCRTAIMRWQMATACRCLLALRQFTARQRQLKESATHVSVRSRQADSLTAWCAWRKLFLVHQAGRCRNLTYYWRKWAAWRNGKQSLNLLQNRIHTVVLKSTQRQAFQSWREYVSRRMMGKAMTLTSSRFSDALVLKRSFVSWRTFVAFARTNKAQMRAVIAHMQSRLVHAAFRSLTAYRDHRRHRRADIARADVFYSQQVVVRMFSGWRTTASTCSAQRERLRRYVNMLQHAVQAKCLRSWSAYTAHRRDLRKTTARSLAMRTQLCLQTLFFEWRQFVAKAKRNQRAMAFQRAHSSSRAFRYWRQFVVLNKVERMMGMCAKRSLEACFVTWRKRVVTMRRVRGFQLETQRKRHIRALSSCFVAWKRWSSVHTRCKRILSRMANGNHLRFRFLLWKEFAAQRRRLALLLQPTSPPSAFGNDETTSLPSDRLHNQQDDDAVAVLRAQLAVKARFFQQFEFSWGLQSVWRYWRLAFHAVLFHRLRTLQRHFLSWKHHSNRRKRARLVIKTLTESRQHSSMLSVFVSWRDVVRRVKQLQAERQRERQLWTIVNTEMLRREKRQLRAHFVAWFALIQDERHLQSSADAYHRARLVTKVWLAWRHDLHVLAALARRQHQEQQRHLRHHALSRAVKALRVNHERRKRARLAIEYCANKRNDQLIPKILARWHKWTNCQRLGVQHHECVVRERLRRVLFGWKSAVELQRRHRAIISMLSEQRTDQVCARVWRTWRRFVTRKRQSRRLLDRAIAFRVRSLLRSRWHERALASSHRRRRFAFAAHQLARFRVQRAARKWRAIVGRRELQRLYRRFVQRKFLFQWQMNVKLALATRFHEWTRRLMAKRMLAEWCTTARRLGHWRRLSASISSLKLVNTQRQTWRKWLAFVETRRLARVAAEFYARRLLCSYWRTWADAARSLVDVREARWEAAMGRFECEVRRRVLTHWRALTQRSKQRRFVVLACVFKLDGFRQKRVLQAVVTAWRRHVQRVRTCRYLTAKRGARVVRGAIGSWRAWVNGRRRQHRKESEVDRYYMHQLVSACFFYWQNYALAWREVDAKSSPLPSAVGRSGLSLLTAGKETVAVVDKYDDVDSDDDEQRPRRPMSPVMKRLAKKMVAATTNKIPGAKKTDASAITECTSDNVNEIKSDVGDRSRDHSNTARDSVMLSLADAAELSIGVRKRLEVLGPWRPSR